MAAAALFENESTWLTCRSAACDFPALTVAFGAFLQEEKIDEKSKEEKPDKKEAHKEPVEAGRGEVVTQSATLT